MNTTRQNITNTQALKAFVTDDQILDCLIMFENRKMDAAKLLASYMFPKWRITTLEAVKILSIVKEEIGV